MRFAIFAIAAVLAVTGSLDGSAVVDAKSSRSSSSSSSAARRSSGSRGGGGSRSGGGRSSRGGPAPTSRRRAEEEEEDEDDFGDFGFPDDEEDEEEEEADEGYDSDARYDEEEDLPPPPRPSRGGRGGPPPRKGAGSRSGGGRGGPPPRRPRYEEEDEYDAYDAEEDEYEERRPSRGGRGGPPPRGSGGRGGPPPRGSGRGGRQSGGSRRGGGGGGGGGGRRGPGGRVVVRGRGPPPQPGAFTRGLTAIRSSIPDPTAVKDAAVAAAAAARETTSKLSSNVYREVKGLTSSELEQVMLKATKPGDTPVKGKHVERLVGVTYQISGRYDIYDAVLRKLWAKMTEKDWRTKTKALYILHRFSSDGAPDHQAALKARLRELRRTRDPKRKEKYFNSKQLLGGDASVESAKYRAFLARYAHYVLLRAQCFGGMFSEISEDPSKSPNSGGKKGGRSPPRKPATSAALRPEHLEAAQMILKSGCACVLKDGEACENTASCVERVAADLVGLVGAVAAALNRSLKNDGPNDGSDPAVVAQWCEFYSDELLPRARRMIKETSPQLDAYGLFLPSRMGASVPQELLQRGLKGAEVEEEEEEPAAEEEEESPEAEADEEEEEEEKVKAAAPARAPKKAEEPAPKKKAPAPRKPEPEPEEEEEDEYDEYEYEEEEYYDDEDA